MTTARAAAALATREPTVAKRRLLVAGLALAGVLVMLGLALLVLFLPLWMHNALDAAGSSELLGVSRSEAHELSDRTVAELFLGPGTFAFVGPDGRPFYGPDEAAHMRDVRLLLYGFLAVVALSAGALGAALLYRAGRPLFWQALAKGGLALAAGVLVVGVFAAVAFDLAFELFHRLFFPAGNWAFDPASQRLVQLYPLAFWQLTVGALGMVALLLGIVAWQLGRRHTQAAGAGQATGWGNSR